ncbi:hypothetical protein DFH27DRAFT_657093 [Peziza echinospora]|nr:hypothetical protein DFH27DRAFT_657093 [Peziza echinospora]
MSKLMKQTITLWPTDTLGPHDIDLGPPRPSGSDGGYYQYQYQYRRIPLLRRKPYARGPPYPSSSSEIDAELEYKVAILALVGFAVLVMIFVYCCWAASMREKMLMEAIVGQRERRGGKRGGGGGGEERREKAGARDAYGGGYGINVADVASRLSQTSFEDITDEERHRNGSRRVETGGRGRQEWGGDMLRN